MVDNNNKGVIMLSVLPPDRIQEALNNPQENYFPYYKIYSSVYNEFFTLLDPEQREHLQSLELRPLPPYSVKPTEQDIQKLFKNWVLLIKFIHIYWHVSRAFKVEYNPSQIPSLFEKSIKAFLQFKKMPIDSKIQTEASQAFLDKNFYQSIPKNITDAERDNFLIDSSKLICKIAKKATKDNLSQQLITEMLVDPEAENAEGVKRFFPKAYAFITKVAQTTNKPADPVFQRLKTYLISRYTTHFANGQEKKEFQKLESKDLNKVLKKNWKHLPKKINLKLQDSRDSRINSVVSWIQQIFGINDKVKFNTIIDEIIKDEDEEEGNFSFTENYNSPKKAPNLIKYLRHERKRLSWTTVVFADVSETIADTIDVLIQPFLIKPILTSSDLGKLVNIFKEMPYKSARWEAVFEKLEKQLKDLTAENLLVIFSTLVEREIKLKEVNKKIPSFVQKAAAFNKQFIQRPGDDNPGPNALNFDAILKKHNDFIKQRQWWPLRKEELNYLYEFERLEHEDLHSSNKVEIEESSSEIEDEYENEEGAIRLTVLKNDEKDLSKTIEEKSSELIAGINEKIYSEFLERDECWPKDGPQDLETRLQYIEERLKELPDATQLKEKMQDWLKTGHMVLNNHSQLAIVRGDSKLTLFYNKLLRSLSILLHAARIMSTDNVRLNNPATYYASAGIEFLGELVHLPVVSALIKSVGSGVRAYGEMDLLVQSENLSLLTLTGYDADWFAQEIALKLTLWLKDDLVKYDEESIEKIAGYTKEKFEALAYKCASENDANNMEATADKYLKLLTTPVKPSFIGSMTSLFTSELKGEEIKHKTPEALLSANRFKKEVYADLAKKKVQKNKPAHGKDLIEINEVQSPVKSKKKNASNGRELEVLQIIQSLTKQIKKMQIELQLVKLTSDEQCIEFEAQIKELKEEIRRLKQPSKVPSRKQEKTPPNSPNKQELLKLKLKRQSMLLAEEGGVPEEFQPDSKALTLEGMLEARPQPPAEQPSEGPSETKEVEIPHYVKVMKEMLETERSFCDGLNFFYNTIEANQKELEKLLSETDFNNLFISMKRIQKIAVNQFVGIEADKITPDNFDDVLENFHKVFTSEDFQYRVCLMSAITKAFNYLSSLANKQEYKAKFKEIFQNNKTHLDYQDYLIMPIQRMPRYELLLKDAQKHYPKPNYFLNVAFEHAKNYGTFLNEEYRAYEEEQRRYKAEQTTKPTTSFISSFFSFGSTSSKGAPSQRIPSTPSKEKLESFLGGSQTLDSSDLSESENIFAN